MLYPRCTSPIFVSAATYATQSSSLYLVHVPMALDATAICNDAHASHVNPQWVKLLTLKYPNGAFHGLTYSALSLMRDAFRKSAFSGMEFTAPSRVNMRIPFEVCMSS